MGICVERIGLFGVLVTVSHEKATGASNENEGAQLPSPSQKGNFEEIAEYRIEKIKD